MFFFVASTQVAAIFIALQLHTSNYTHIQQHWAKYTLQSICQQFV